MARSCDQTSSLMGLYPLPIAKLFENQISPMDCVLALTEDFADIQPSELEVRVEI